MRDDFGQYDTKQYVPPIFGVFFGQTPLSYSVAMATPNVPGDKKLFERACFMLKIKVTKFQLHTHNGFLAVLKIQLGGGGGGGGGGGAYSR